jgi:hypothetical protein
LSSSSSSVDICFTGAAFFFDDAAFLPALGATFFFAGFFFCEAAAWGGPGAATGVRELGAATGAGSLVFARGGRPRFFGTATSPFSAFAAGVVAFLFGAIDKPLILPHAPPSLLSGPAATDSSRKLFSMFLYSSAFSKHSFSVTTQYYMTPIDQDSMRGE